MKPRLSDRDRWFADSPMWLATPSSSDVKGCDNRRRKAFHPGFGKVLIVPQYSGVSMKSMASSRSIAWKQARARSANCAPRRYRN